MRPSVAEADCTCYAIKTRCLLLLPWLRSMSPATPPPAHALSSALPSSFILGILVTNSPTSKGESPTAAATAPTAAAPAEEEGEGDCDGGDDVSPFLRLSVPPSQLHFSLDRFSRSSLFCPFAKGRERHRFSSQAACSRTHSAPPPPPASSPAPPGPKWCVSAAAEGREGGGE